MVAKTLLTEQQLDALCQFETPMIANAVEIFDLRLRNTGFTNGKIRCMFPDAQPMVSYAATGQLRCGEPPMKGSAFHGIFRHQAKRIYEGINAAISWITGQA
jgi:hypothetical protein